MQKKIKIPKLSLSHLEDDGEVKDYRGEDLQLRHIKVTNSLLFLNVHGSDVILLRAREFQSGLLPHITVPWRHRPWAFFCLGFFGGVGRGCLRQQLRFPQGKQFSFRLYHQAESCDSVCSVVTAEEVGQHAFHWHTTLERSLLTHMDTKRLLVWGSSLERVTITLSQISEGGLAAERYG